MTKIAFFSSKPYDIHFFDTENKPYGFNIHYFDCALDENSIAMTKGFEVVCAFVNDTLNASCIEALKKNQVKLIALRSAGFNHVNIKSCQEHNITVVRVPAYSPYAVAEHTMALLLTLNRKTHKAYQRIREGNFSLNGLLGFDLHNKTIGIIGFGKIGARFAAICQGFGLKILAYDPKPAPSLSKDLSVQFVELHGLLSQSDIISLHCPLTSSNRHMINEKTIQTIKKGAVILNTGRGALIDTKALIEGLKSEHIGAVGLDVYEQESNLFFEDHSDDIIDDDILMRLTTFPNVLITAHQGFFTKEALTEIAAVTLSNIQSIISGTPCLNEITSD